MSSIRPRLCQMNPVLTIRDLQGSMDYYVDTLGFETTWLYGDPPIRAGIARDGFEMQIAESPDGPPGLSMVYFQVTNVDDYYQQCRERGAIIETELGDRPFGMRDFRVLDPSGNKLGFGEPLEPQ